MIPNYASLRIQKLKTSENYLKEGRKIDFSRKNRSIKKKGLEVGDLRKIEKFVALCFFELSCVFPGVALETFDIVGHLKVGAGSDIEC